MTTARISRAWETRAAPARTIGSVSPATSSCRRISVNEVLSRLLDSGRRKHRSFMNLRPPIPKTLVSTRTFLSHMESTGLARFLFELASDERLGILDVIEEKPLRHAQIARRLKITDSETTRHLNRLASTGLLTKNPQSQYEPTSLARLVSAGFPFFRFLLAHREFLLKYDVRVVPAEFVERLGALNGGTFVTGMYDVAAAQERYLRAVKQRIWVLTDQLFEAAGPVMRGKAGAGADVRVVRSRGGGQRETARLPPVQRNYPGRLGSEARKLFSGPRRGARGGVPSPRGKGGQGAEVLVFQPGGHPEGGELVSPV